MGSQNNQYAPIPDRENMLVTILITARNRPGELRRTLQGLRCQTYHPLELLVIDDASDENLEDVVRKCWPEARFVRNPQNLGLIASRSLGMKMARGTYVCSLDDDSCFVQPNAVERAVARVEAEKQIGILSFLIIHGHSIPKRFETPWIERYVASYIGCGHMIRRKVIEELGGYRDFYFYYGEEGEYSLRALEAGWRILFYPSVIVHHRVSPRGRNQGRLLGYSFRNNLFTILLNLPWQRAVPEAAWKVMVYGVEALRLLELRWTLWAVCSLLAHLTQVWRMRTPVSWKTVRLYDILRFATVTSGEAFGNPLPVSLRRRLAWFRDTWWRRRRSRPFWDRRSGGIGVSETASFGDAKSV